MSTLIAGRGLRQYVAAVQRGLDAADIDEARRRVGEINLRFAFPDATDDEIRQRNKNSIQNVGVAAFAFVER